MLTPEQTAALEAAQAYYEAAHDGTPTKQHLGALLALSNWLNKRLHMEIVMRSMWQHAVLELDLDHHNAILAAIREALPDVDNETPTRT